MPVKIKEYAWTDLRSHFSDQIYLVIFLFNLEASVQIPPHYPSPEITQYYSINIQHRYDLNYWFLSEVVSIRR